ncbi:MAG: hypothetical protein ACI8Y4_002135 [Candidatus Poriferisodalaceae bacterium]|jgi:hypothetical protein
MALFTVLALLAASCGGGADSPSADADATDGGSSVTSTEAVATTDSVGETPDATAPESATTTLDDDLARPSEVAPTTSEAELLAAMACGSVGSPSATPTLTFMSEGRLFETTGRPGDLSCFAEVGPIALSGSGRDMVWNPTGTSVRVGNGVVIDATGVIRSEGAIIGEALGWTWPAGQRFLAGDGTTLVKETPDGRGGNEIGSIQEWTAVAYHPDGQHIAMAGTALMRSEFDDGEGGLQVEEFSTGGLHITDNEGLNPANVAHSEDVRIDEIVFSADGTRLTFTAWHLADGTHHVHSLDLPAGITVVDDERWFTPVAEDPELLLPAFESAGALSHLTINPYDPDRILFAEGECGGVVTTELLDVRSGGYPTPIAPDLNAVPVGFLEGDLVAVLELDPACAGSGNLWVINIVTGDRTLVAEGVEAAATRWVAPDLNFSLQDVVIVGLA